MFGKGRERNVQAARQLRRVLRRRNPQNAQASSGNPLGERADEKRRRRTSAQADDHSIFNELRSGLASSFFPLILFRQIHEILPLPPSRRTHHSRSNGGLPIS